MKNMIKTTIATYSNTSVFIQSQDLDMERIIYFNNILVMSRKFISQPINIRCVVFLSHLVCLVDIVELD